jgi:hypothetical protein
MPDCTDKQTVSLFQIKEWSSTLNKFVPMVSANVDVVTVVVSGLDEM